MLTYESVCNSYTTSDTVFSSLTLKPKKNDKLIQKYLHFVWRIMADGDLE